MNARLQTELEERSTERAAWRVAERGLRADLREAQAERSRLAAECTAGRAREEKLEVRSIYDFRCSSNFQ